MACDCVCPGCGSRLVAHHGTKKVKHFVHYSTGGCDRGFESAIHRAAKQILLEHKEILVPAIQAGTVLYDKGANVEIREIQCIPERFVQLDEVEVEMSVGSVIPDLIVTALGKELYVEIAYTHFVDEEKRRKLKELGIPTFEVDLSGLSDVPSMSELARLVVSEPSNRYWVFNQKESELARRVSTVAQDKLALAIANVQQMKEEYQRWAEQYRNMTDEEKLSVELKELGISRDNLPSYLGIFIKGGGSFSAHMRVWQTAIFTNFIYNKMRNYFDVEDVCNWSCQFFKLKRVFPNSEKVAVWYFLKHLESLGFLMYCGNQMFMVRRDQLRELAMDREPYVPADHSEEDLPF